MVVGWAIAQEWVALECGSDHPRNRLILFPDTRREVDCKTAFRLCRWETNQSTT